MSTYLAPSPFFEGLKKKNVKSSLYTLLSSYSDKLWENFGIFHQVSTKLSAYLRYESSVLAQACIANDFLDAYFPTLPPIL